MSNYCAMRRVVLKKKSILQDKIRWVPKRQRNSYTQRNKQPLAPLLDNLTELYECSTEGNIEFQWAQIHSLPLKDKRMYSQ